MKKGAPSAGRDGGFTVVELVVAITLLAVIMIFSAQLVYGGLNALSASNQRSNFLEIANGEVEAVRALRYEAVGVLPSADPPGYDSAYEGAGTPRTHQGRPAIAIADTDFTAEIRASVPAVVTTMTSSEVVGLPVPYTIRRWVTSDTVNGGPPNAFKRLDVRVEWTENNRSSRSISLTSRIYPGGQGVPLNNNPPSAVMSYTPTTCIPVGSPVAFSSAGSADPEGSSVSYSWAFGDGATSFDAAPSHTFAAAGTYNTSLAVTDSQGGVGSTSQSVSVGASSGAPPTVAAVVNPTPTEGVAPFPVNVNAAATTDTDSSLTFRWVWGDGTPDGTTSVSSHTYDTPGSYTLRLVVQEDGCRETVRDFPVVVVPLQCQIISGRFRQAQNAADNDIKVGSNGQVASNQKRVNWEVVTNAACTSGVQVRVPRDQGELIVNLTSSSASGGNLVWQRTADDFQGVTFVLGTPTASVWYPTINGAARKSFSVNVHL